MRRFTVYAALSAGLLLTSAGCGPKPHAGWQNPLDAMEKSLPTDAKNPNYVLTRMEFSRQAIDMGCYSRAKPRLDEAFKQFDTEQSNVAAAIGSESNKYYKGETYERAMVCWYLGYIAYRNGDYNNARIYFARAIAEDRKAVVSKDTPEIYGDDFGLAYYWLGKAYQKLGDADNARIAFAKAWRVSPRKKADEELTKDRQQAVAARKACIQG